MANHAALKRLMDNQPNFDTPVEVVRLRTSTIASRKAFDSHAPQLKGFSGDYDVGYVSFIDRTKK